MEYSTEQLPDLVLETCQVAANFLTRNARFRQAICQHFQLRWLQVDGSGNCFFHAVCELLMSANQSSNIEPQQLRSSVVEFLRLQPGSTQALSERLTMEMECEVGQAITASTRESFHGRRLNNFVPIDIEEYLDVMAHDGTWCAGFHWFRAISVLYDVRVGIVIYGQGDSLIFDVFFGSFATTHSHLEIIRYFGSGETTIYLYKIDADTHFDALLPSRPSISPTGIFGDDDSDDSSSDESLGNADRVEVSTPPHATSTLAAPIPTALPRLKPVASSAASALLVNADVWRCLHHHMQLQLRRPLSRLLSHVSSPWHLLPHQLCLSMQTV
jgi:hypothetical protein